MDARRVGSIGGQAIADECLNVQLRMCGYVHAFIVDVSMTQHTVETLKFEARQCVTSGCLDDTVHGRDFEN